MAKQLRATCILMALISINLLPMHNPKLNKKLTYSRNAKKKELEYKDVLLSPPSSVPYFKQKSIVLQKNNTNQYSLIFNCQQPCITQYLLEGNPVAKLIQIGDEINFESEGYRAYDFSLQIPYQADSLTINTRGRFIFEKKIDVYSAYLTCKTVDFRENFFSNNGLIIEADSCRNQAQLTCSDLLFKGKKFEIMPKSSLSAHNSLTLMAQSLVLNQGTVDCWKESFVQSGLFKNEGTLTSYNMHFDGDEVINSGILSIGDTFHCASKLFDHRGILDVSRNCIIEKGDTFSSTPLSVWSVHGDWKAFINSLSLSGSFNVKNLYVVGKNFTSKQSLHCIVDNAHLKIKDDMVNAGVIKVLELLNVKSKNIKLEKTSCISADNADLKVDQVIHNEGTISVKEHLSVHSHCISNTGKIKTNSSDIKADRYYYNKIFSTLSAKKNLTINTPIYFNLLGITHAQRLMINSAVVFNALGIYTAKNMIINSFFSLNAGLLLPKFGALSEIYSPANLWGCGEFLFIKYASFYGAIYAALKSVKEAYHQGRAFYDEIGSLRKQKNIGASDAIALICSIKNIVNSALQTYQLGKQSYRLLSDSPQSDNSQVFESSSDIMVSAKDVAQQIVSTVATHYAPSVTTSSIIDYNYGVTMGINNHSSSLYHRNSNISLYAQNTIDTRYGKNTGYLGAYNVNINATSSYNSDGNIRASNLTLHGKNSVHMKGDITTNKTAIKSDRYITINSRLTSTDVHLHAKSISQGSTITAQQVVMNGDDISNYGTINAPKTIITQANLPSISWFGRDQHSFYNTGNIQASDQLFVDVKNIKLSEKSKIDTPNAYFKSDGNWQNDGNITAEQLIFDVTRYMTNNGSLQAPKIIVNPEKSNDNDWSLCAFRNTGSMQAADQLFVDAGSVNLDEKSKIASPNAYFKNNSTWQNDGDITAKQLVIDGKGNITNSGSLQAPKIIITQNKSDDKGWRANLRAFHNTGNIQASEQLFVAAKNIKLSEKSKIDTPNAYFKSNGDWQNDGKLKTEQCIIDGAGKTINTNDISAEQLLHVKAQNILFDSKSNIKSKDACYKADQNVLINGVMDVERGSIDAGGKVKAIGRIGASNQFDIKAKDIVIEKTSHVSTPKTYLRATETINSCGKLSTSNLYSHAKYVQNSGEIISDNAHIKADRYFWNTFGGSINIENALSMDALASMNTFGWIYANNLTINTGIDLNLCGIYRAETSHVNALIDLNGGFYIPKFNSNSWGKRFTKRNAWSAGVNLLSKVSPVAGLLCSLGTTIYSICEKDGLKDQAIKLYDHANRLYTDKNAGASDWIVVACGAKNIAMPTLQTAKMVKQGYEMMHPDEKIETFSDTTAVQTNFEEQTKSFFDTLKDKVADATYQTASTLTSNFGPHMNRDTLVDLNCGAMLGINGSSRSIYNLNRGASLFANSYNINTCYGYNGGILAAAELSVQAAKTYSSAGVVAGINASMAANDLNINGNVRALNNTNLTAHNKANVDADLSARNVGIQARNSLKLGTETTINGGDVTINTASFEGNAGNKITSTNKTSIKTAHIDNKGSTTGVLELEFAGGANQLKSIGTVDDIRYSGTLENNLADTFAEGKSDLVNVTQSGSVTLFAGDQNIHLKDEHTMNHALKIESYGAVKCDKKLTSSRFIDLKAKGNLEHKSINATGKVSLGGKNIIARSTIIRTGDGANYEDHVEDITITGSGIEAHADEHIIYEAIKTHSGKDGTTITANGKNISAAVTAEKHTENQTFDKKTYETKITKDTFTTAHVCEHTSEDVITILAGDTVELQGTTIDSKGGNPIINGNNGVNGYTAYDTHLHESEYQKEGGWFSKDKYQQSTSGSKTPKTVKFIGSNTPEITSNSHISLPFTSDSSRIILNAPLVENTLAQQSTSSHSKNYWAYAVESEKHVIKEDVTYSSFKGIIETNAQKIYCDEVKGHVSPIYQTTHKDVQFTRNVLDELHTHKNPSSLRPTRAASCAIAMAVAMLTSGVGASVGGTIATIIGCKSALSAAVVTNITASAITSLSVQATDTLSKCNGDLKKAAKIIASTDTLKNMVLSATTSGAMVGAGQVLNKIGLPAVKDAHNLGERLIYAAPRQLANGTIKTVAHVITGQEFKEAAKQNVRSVLAGTIGVACTSQIGDAYAKEQIDPVSHKLLHTGVGAVEGAILGGFNGAIAGGIGALVTETVADVLAPEIPSLTSIRALELQMGRPLTREEFTQTWDDQMSAYWQGVASTADISRFTAASVVLLSRQDIDIANTVSSTALDNNFLILAGYGLVAAGVAYSAYEINNAYKEGGPEAALKQLGVEVVTHVACFGAGKVAFKVGHVMYPSAKVAVAAALEALPGLNFALGELTEILVFAGEKIGKSALGKGVSAIEINLVNTTNKITQKLGNAGNKIIDKAGKYVNSSFAEDLVDHVVPHSVISKIEAQAGKQIVKSTETTLVQTLGNLTKPDLVMTTPEGVKISVPDKGEAGLIQQSMDQVNNIVKDNISGTLKDNYYEVNGFKFTQFYYNRLWDNGRKYPGFRAESVLRGATTIVPDPQGYEGFFKYIYNDWEMIFNPSTKVVAHLSPISKAKHKLI